MLTSTAATNNNMQPLALHECARVLVAAQLTEERAPLHTFQDLLAKLRGRPLLEAAERLFKGLAALAEERHGSVAAAAPATLHARTMLSMYMIVLHPADVFERPSNNALEGALATEAAALLRVFYPLLGALASATDVAELQFELTAELLPRMAAYVAAFAAWKASNEPRLVCRLHLNIMGLLRARMAAALEDADAPLYLEIDAQLARSRAVLAHLPGGEAALAVIDATPLLVADITANVVDPDDDGNNAALPEAA